MCNRLLTFCVVCFVFTNGCRRDASNLADHANVDASDTPLSDPAPVITDIHPDVAKLLERKIEENAVPEFVERLEKLAKNQGWQEQLTEWNKRSFSEWEDAYAASIASGEMHYVVVLLKSYTTIIPGEDLQTVILLDNQGRFLDLLGCEISSRLRMEGGKFHTAILREAESDGTQLVIRLDGQSARGNFSHHIYHDGVKADYYWGHYHLADDQPTKWDTKGLCRIGIKDGKLKVLFPGEKDKEQRP
jgi:hypothetical protein